jgi:hypothetical protein
LDVVSELLGLRQKNYAFVFGCQSVEAEGGRCFTLLVHSIMIMIDTKYQYPTMNLKEFSASKIKQVEASLPACGFCFQRLLYPKMLYVHSL